MTYVGRDPPIGSSTERSDARPGSLITPPLWQIAPDPQSTSGTVPTPFGLVRIWEAEGQTFVAETSTDGSLLGPALALAGAGVTARGASATVHRLDASFFLTVTWLSEGQASGPGDFLSKSWELGRGSVGLTLTAANDNPIVVGTGATEGTVTALPGEALLFTWVEGDTGNVYGQVRTPQEGAAAPALLMGQSTLDPACVARRVQVREVAPFDYAVLWLAANGRELTGVYLSKEMALSAEDEAWSTRPFPSVALAGDVAGGFAVTRGTSAGAIDVIYTTTDANGISAEVRQSIPLAPDRGVDGAMSGVAKADDFGFMWASQDLLHLAPSALYAPDHAASRAGPLVTRGDEPLLIDLAEHGAGHGVKIVAVDGTPLEANGATRIANGWLQARHDGHLTFTPDVDAMGHIRLFLAGVSESGAAWSRHLDIHIEGLYEAARVELSNPVKAIPAHAVIAHHAQMAEIGIRGEAPPHGAVSLSGVDAEKFVVIGNGLFLRAGTRLEPGRKALDVAVHFKDGLAGAAVAASLTIAVLNDPGSFLSLALPGRAQAAEISTGQVVAEVGVMDQAVGGDRISLALLSNAGGRFALSGGNLVVASPHLLTPDPEATYDVVVRMAQPNGIAIDHKITLHHDDILGRLPPGPEKAPAPPVEERPPPPPAASGEIAAEGSAASTVAAETATSERSEPNRDTSDQPQDGDVAGILPPLHVEAPMHSAKGSSGQPDLGAGAGFGATVEKTEGLAKVLAEQQRDSSGGDHGGRESRGSDKPWNRDDDRSHSFSYERDLVDALRHLGRGGHDDRGGRGSDYKSDLQKAQDAVSGDTIFFKPGFGKETIEHVKLSGGEAHDVLDLSLYGTTFEALRAAGAFEQVGNDVVLTLNPADPAHSDQIILKSIELHQIDPGDFKFS